MLEKLNYGREIGPDYLLEMVQIILRHVAIGQYADTLKSSDIKSLTLQELIDHSEGLPAENLEFQKKWSEPDSTVAYIVREKSYSNFLTLYFLYLSGIESVYLLDEDDLKLGKLSPIQDEAKKAELLSSPWRNEYHSYDFG